MVGEAYISDYIRHLPINTQRTWNKLSKEQKNQILPWEEEVVARTKASRTWFNLFKWQKGNNNRNHTIKEDLVYKAIIKSIKLQILLQEPI